MLLEHADHDEAEDAYTAALLHDIGKLMLANNLPDQFQKALDLSAESRMKFADAEQNVFGATHTGVGAYLLGLWGLPAVIVEAVAFHHTPARSDTRKFSPLTAVHAANALEHEISGVATRGEEPALDMDYLAAIGVQDRIETWRDEAANLLSADRN